ncbi:MAG: Hsp70 family protein [Spirochaetia bacterium]|jgi:hypothetical protein|nr:Hsp70 family protein [Spirochaetia bacterium]
MAKIGIRLADGKFYSILDEGIASKKRLVVTTVKDDQPSVQIDVYRSTEASDSYVGSLIIENIPPRPAGEPDIRLDLGLDEEGNLNALAREEATGEHQALTVSLKSLAEEEKYEIPDFDFQEDEEFDLSTDDLPDVNPFDTDSYNLVEDNLDEPTKDDHVDSLEDDGQGGIPDFSDEEEQPYAKAKKERGRSNPIVVGILAAIGTAIILIAAFFIYQCTADRQLPPPQTSSISAPATVAPAPVTTPSPEPVTTPAPEPAKLEAPEPAPLPVASPAKKEGTWYKIRWGDTLWDLSIAYYRTPWLYQTIAKANKIRNPDLIISGTWIYIPPR